MKAYKVFDKDWKCKDFQYEIGKTYELKDSNGNIIEPIMCNKGFHACLKINNCFNYYDFNSENKVAEVELDGIILGLEDDKQCCNKITIIKELTWNEMLLLANTGKGNSGHNNSGDMNSGDRNSGNRNSGDRNSGDRNSGNRNSGNLNSGNRNSGDRNSDDNNSGDMNSGDRNSGDMNSGNRNSGRWNSINNESGYFNSKKSLYINIFNKKCKIGIWENAKKPNFIYNLILNEWIYFSEMTDEEKIKYPKAFVCDGYLKTYSYKEAWENSYKKASKEEIELLKKLPNFDSKVFEEITGIKL